jgi:hypothetical protein
MARVFPSRFLAYSAQHYTKTPPRCRLKVRRCLAPIPLHRARLPLLADGRQAPQPPSHKKFLFGRQNDHPPAHTCRELNSRYGLGFRDTRHRGCRPCRSDPAGASPANRRAKERKGPAAQEGAASRPTQGGSATTPEGGSPTTTEGGSATTTEGGSATTAAAKCPAAAAEGTPATTAGAESPTGTAAGHNAARRQAAAGWPAATLQGPKLYGGRHLAAWRSTAQRRGPALSGPQA